MAWCSLAARLSVGPVQTPRQVVNLARLGLGTTDVDRVFGRFVKELYILSQMHSERWVRMFEEEPPRPG